MANIIYLKLTNPVLEIFLRWVFNSPTGPVQIHQRTFVGKFISQLASLTREEPKSKEGIMLNLGDDGSRNLHRYFLYYREADHAAIEAILETFYYVELMLHVSEGQAIGLPLKSIIISFIDQLGGETERLNFEALRKYITRERMKRRKLLLRQKRMHLSFNLLIE